MYVDIGGKRIASTWKVNSDSDKSEGKSKSMELSRSFDLPRRYE